MDLSGRLVAVVSRNRAGQARIAIWSCLTATLLGSRPISLPTGDKTISFTQDGGYVAIRSWIDSPSGPHFEVTLLRISDLRSPPGMEGRLEVVGSDNVSPSLFVGQTASGMTIFNTRNGRTSHAPPRLLDRLSASANSRRLDRAAFLHDDGTVELWNTVDWRSIPLPRLPGRPTQIHFSADDTVLLVRLIGGGYSLIDAQSGSLIATLADLGEVQVAYYDSECQRVHFWTREGFVLRYIRGRRWPILGFRPARACDQ